MPDPSAPETGTADERLRAFLRGDPPSGIAALDAADRGRLADLLEDTRRRQSASLEQAFRETLKHVPFPVRGIVRKVLWG